MPFISPAYVIHHTLFYVADGLGTELADQSVNITQTQAARSTLTQETRGMTSGVCPSNYLHIVINVLLMLSHPKCMQEKK